jgi:pentatricopeptide repeat protein
VGRAEEALHYFDKMRAANVRPNHFTYHALIGACGRAKDWKKAKEVRSTIHCFNTNALPVVCEPYSQLSSPLGRKGPVPAAA